MARMNPQPTYPKDGRYALTQHKSVGELIGSTVKIWLSKPSVFIVAALIVVLPMELVLTGVLGGGFSDADGTADELWTAIDGFAVGFLGLALITAAHARAVVALAAGERVSTASALRLGGGAFVSVLGVAVLYTLATILGTIALIIPGIYLSVVLMFGTQIAALTRTGISDSLDASIKLVRAVGWWRTFGYLLLITVLSYVPAFVIALPLAVLGDAVDDPSIAGPVLVLVGGIVQALVYSFTALIQSLLYFSYRAKVGEPWGQEREAGSPDLEAGADWNPSASSVLSDPTG